MKERPLTVGVFEAKGLNDGSITTIVRVMEKQPSEWPGSNAGIVKPWHDNSGGWWYAAPDDEPGEVSLHQSPFGEPGTRLRAVCEPGEPCEHRGCLSHVTHVCEGCGRGHAGILLDVTHVRVVQVWELGPLDALSAGAHIDWRPAPHDPVSQMREVIGKDVWDANPWIWLATVAKV